MGSTFAAPAELTIVFQGAEESWSQAAPGLGTTLISETPPPDRRPWIPLSDLIASAAIDQAIDLLAELNALTDTSGYRLAGLATHRGLETWWCHQQAVLDQYLVPFARYQPLLTLCELAEQVAVHGCPPDLGRVLPLVVPPDRLRLVHPPGRRPSLLRLRRISSSLIYGFATAVAFVKHLVRGTEFLVYSYDATDEHGQNRWIDGLHAALRVRGLRFLEIVWSDSGRRALRQLRARGRSVLYWQSLAPVRTVDSAVTRVEQPTQPGDLPERVLRSIGWTVMLPAARSSVRTARRLEAWLRRLRPRGVFLMDDPVHVWELVIACRGARIPTVAVQHGQLSRATAGLMGHRYDGPAELSFDRYCVWSDYFRDLLVRHGRLIPPAAIVATGRPRAPGRAPIPVSPGSRRVVVLGEHVAAEVCREAAGYARALIEAGLDTWIRPHPASVSGADLLTCSDRAAARVAYGSLEEVLAGAGVVVASFSSAIFDAILHEVPVVLFSTSLHSDPHELASAGVADLARSPDELPAMVRAAMELPPVELARRRDIVWRGGLEHRGGEAAVREMEALLGHHSS